MPDREMVRLYEQWMAMWNGDLSLASEIVAEGCIVHQAPFGEGEPVEFRGPEGIARMVEMGRAPFDEFAVKAEVGPVAEGALVAARWTGSGRYRGGLPGATASPGTLVTYSGADFFQIEAGKIAEYWVSADVYALMAQLGAVAS
jgi:predicted ester cyclase